MGVLPLVNIKRCSGPVRGGIPNESPGKTVPWSDGGEPYRHCEKIEGLRVIRVIIDDPRAEEIHHYGA